MQDGPLHPWRICKTTVHKPHKMTHAYFEICSIANESVLHGRVRSTEGMRHDPNDGKNDARFLYPCVALCLKKKKERERRGCSASLPSAAMWPEHGADLPEMLPAAGGALLPNSLCCNSVSISPCSDRRWPCVLCKTLHPLDHDARSKGELHSTGARRGDGPAISFQWTTEINCGEKTSEPMQLGKRTFSNSPPNICHMSFRGALPDVSASPGWSGLFLFVRFLKVLKVLCGAYFRLWKTFIFLLYDRYIFLNNKVACVYNL